MKIFILVLFLLTYALIVALPKFKVYITGAACLVAVISCAISGDMGVLSALSGIKINVVLVLVGIMLTVGLFSETGMPNKMADKLVSKTPNALWAIVLLCALSGLISAFVDNVTTVLMLAPIGLAIAKKTDVSPIPVIIGISVSSNLQGAATLVGDTTSVMLADFAEMNFFEFFFLNGKPSIFFAVEIGALLTIPFLIFIFRKDNKKIKLEPSDSKVTSLFPTVMLLINLVLLIVFSFVSELIPVGIPFVKWLVDNGNGLICFIIGIICLIHHTATVKSNPIKTAIGAIDVTTVLFLIFLFVLIKAVESVGIIADIASLFTSIGNSNVFLLYTVIVFGSVLISAFIDNIPYVATMLPVISGLCVSLPSVSPYLLYFGLLCGATLGGNLTPVGASANVVGIGILSREGYNTTYKDFFKIGLPFTLIAVLSGYAFIWIFWGMM